MTSYHRRTKLARLVIITVSWHFSCCFQVCDSQAQMVWRRFSRPGTEIIGKSGCKPGVLQLQFAPQLLQDTLCEKSSGRRPKLKWLDAFHPVLPLETAQRWRTWALCPFVVPLWCQLVAPFMVPSHS